MLFGIYYHSSTSTINSSPLDKMPGILADDNFKRIFLNENEGILTQISLKFVPRSPIDNKPTLVQVMACCLFCDTGGGGEMT